MAGRWEADGGGEGTGAVVLVLVRLFTYDMRRNEQPSYNQ